MKKISLIKKKILVTGLGTVSRYRGISKDTVKTSWKKYGCRKYSSKVSLKLNVKEVSRNSNGKEKRFKLFLKT